MSIRRARTAGWPAGGRRAPAPARTVACGLAGPERHEPSRAAAPAARGTGAWGARAAVLVLLAVLAAGCGKDEPVGQVSVEPATVRLAYPQPVPVRLTWTPKEPLESKTGKVLVFVHLLATPGQPVRTFDHELPEAWTPGKPISYSLDLGQSALAPQIPPGRYRLTLGLYDGERRRWPLSGLEEVARREYAVADVEVPPSAAPAPAFKFSPAWGPPERTGNNQSPLRRWMEEPATIAVASPPSAGVVRLAVRIPEVNEAGGERLLLDAGAGQPAVALTATCDGTRRELAGYGLHEVEVRVAAGQGCEIAVDPRFKVARVDQVTARPPAFLEELLWKPEATPAPAS